MLEVRNVTKRFCGLSAVDKLDLNVKEGEIVGIIGPNGAGKTTLLNLITGYYKPNEGTILFEGKNITGLPPHRICRLGIARTFQIVKPLRELTVLENALIGRIFGRDHKKQQAVDEVKEILSILELDKKLYVRAGNLTFAEARKLEVAKALACNPKLILFDEVFAGLNPAEVADMCRKVETIKTKYGVTIMFVEHVMKAITTLAKRIVVMHYGKKIAEGPPEEVLNYTAVVTAYLGERTLA